MWLLNPYWFAAAYDTDAAAYIAAVEAADGQTLETGVKDAINQFVIGCKADGIWTAIKASCILAGARTLAGALVPLVGTAPTNFNFVAGDYNRKTGLKGDGSTKYLNSNQTATATSPTNYHQSTYVSAKPSVNMAFVSSDNLSDQRYLLYSNFAADETRAISGALGGTVYFGGAGSLEVGFKGVTRNSSTTFNARSNAITSPPISSGAGTSTNLTSFIFANNVNGALNNHGDGRLAFYSIGASLNLALLDARVTTLINAISAAIP